METYGFSKSIKTGIWEINLYSSESCVVKIIVEKNAKTLSNLQKKASPMHHFLRIKIYSLGKIERFNQIKALIRIHRIVSVNEQSTTDLFDWSPRNGR